MKRYTAKLLFQYRVVEDGDRRMRRTCEERIIVFQAKSAKTALQYAKRKGKVGQRSYKNGEGSTVKFEFVGVMDLLHLGSECDEDEVWYDIKEILTPSERKDKLIPPEESLNAFREEAWNRKGQ